MKRQVFYVVAARAGKNYKQHQVKIWIPAELARKLRIQSGDTIKLTYQHRRVTLCKSNRSTTE